MKPNMLIKVTILTGLLLTPVIVLPRYLTEEKELEKTIYQSELTKEDETCMSTKLSKVDENAFLCKSHSSNMLSSIFSNKIDDDSDPFLDFFPVIIGQPNDMRLSPFYFNLDNSLSQSVYTAREVGLGGGYISGIQYRIWFEEASPQTHIKLWLGETEQPDLSQGWIDVSAFQLVFDKVIDFPEGEMDLFFPFKDPYLFKGDNLVVHASKSGEALQGKNVFFSQVAKGSARTRSLQPGISSEPDTIPQQGGSLLNELPFIVIFLSWDGLKPLVLEAKGTGKQEEEINFTEPKEVSTRVQRSTSNPDGLQITEFIFNETITKLGSDFYYYFFQQWENPSGVEGLSIHVQERPIPGMGGLVMVKVENQMVYQGMLRPNIQIIRDAASSAIQRTQAYFTNYEMIQQQLESDDLRGTGVY